MTKFGMFTQVTIGRSVFLSIPRGGAPASQKNFVTAYIRSRSINNQIVHGDQTRCEENFYRVDHER